MAIEISKFVRFIKAAGWYGAGSVALAAILFAVSIYEHLVGKNVAAYWLLLLANAFFSYGAYKAWAEIESVRDYPKLKIAIQQAFFDVVMPSIDKNAIVQIHTFLKVTNVGKLETVIDEAELTLSVRGIPFKGTLVRSVKANAIEHFTNFKIGGEVFTDHVFKNILSPFRVLAHPDADQILRPGLTREGFLTFSFPDLKDWNQENLYQIQANDALLSLKDSYGHSHSTKMQMLDISNGTPRTDGRFA